MLRVARESGVPSTEPASDSGRGRSSQRLTSSSEGTPDSLASHKRLVNVIATTRMAPASLRARAQDERVAPVVSTSSIRRTLRGTCPRAWIRGGWPMRSARRLPTWRPPPRRMRQELSGSSVRCARAAAISAAGSKPRRAERRGAVGTGTIVPLRIVPGTSQWMRSTIRSATGRRRRNLSAATRSRATPSWGAEDQARSSPGAPKPSRGSASASRREQRVQSVASGRQVRPHAAQSGGTMAVATAWRSFMARSSGPAARVWRAECQFFVKPLAREPQCHRSGPTSAAARHPRAGSSRGRWRRRRSGNHRR